VNSLTQLLVQSDEPTKTKKCPKCGEVKSLKDYYGKKRKEGQCKICSDIRVRRYVVSERGYLNKKYRSMLTPPSKKKRKHHRPTNRHLTFKEFLAAFEEHKSIYGMKSAWGPGVNNLEQHLPITIILTKNPDKKAKRMDSNLSIDRLDNNRDYTVQNIIFIRGDENARKKDTTYEDCKIQIRLHEERFGK
tara:strand:- start:40 stop:609 length:570 start_codon:yes stop_codon:yes gene_type:complete